MPQWTEEQRQVIESRGQNLLVSAAAGSGKSAVLVERIMEKVLDAAHPADIDRMLVVTFTNAAAASVREKIRLRLEAEAAGQDKTRARLAMRQLSLLSGDHIETIDRFCREIVLDHADALGIDPSFRIGDDGELTLLSSETVSQVIEESFEDPDDDIREAVLSFARLYAPGRTDRALENLILQFYRFSMSHEFPRMWRRGCARLYQDGPEAGQAEQAILLDVKARIGELLLSLREGLAVCMNAAGPYHYTQAMASHVELLEDLAQCGTLCALSDLLRTCSWEKPGAKKRKAGSAYVDPVLEDQVKGIRNQVKKALDRLAGNYFFAPEEEIEKMRLATARHMETLILLTDRFEDRYAREKELRRIADFSDVAHWALRVLIRVDEDGMPVLDEEGGYLRTRLAEEYREHFQEIYIDEYQDSNRVQEILLQSIANAGGRFMVGDMKQSIYRFRMADTGIFLEKARQYAPDADAPDRRIGLHRNFRSRPEVLDCVNLVFRQIMRSEIGGVDYADSEALRPGYPFPPSPAAGSAADPAAGTVSGSASALASDSDTAADPAAGPASGEAEGSCDARFTPELILAEKGDVPSASSAAEAEATVVAQRILSMAGSMLIYDKKKNAERPVRYEDITILLRTASGWAETFSKVLSEYGIPNRPDANTGYFDAVEVRTILAYLNVLDNPRQDIPLAAALRSRIGGLDDTQLSLIRAQSGESAWYDCILEYCRKGPDAEIRRKLERFLDLSKELRALVKDTPIHILLWEIFDRTHYEEQILAMEGGRQKAANLELLVDMAMAYEQTSYQGLFHFIRYIENLRKAQKDIGQAAEGGSRENLVRVMTMHKSKGLEFPVVFVCGLNKKFNLQDAQGVLVMHEHLGAGLDWRDERLMVKRKNRIQSLISDRIRADSVGEELRVLYVAMTRAEQKLILTGCVDSRKSTVGKALERRADRKMKLPATVIQASSCMLDWILAALSRLDQERAFFDSARWEGIRLPEEDAIRLPGRIRILTGTDVLRERTEEAMEEERRLEALFAGDPEQISDPAYHKRLSFMLSRESQRWKERVPVPGKLSVSQIKHEAYEAELRRLLMEEGLAEPEEAMPWTRPAELSGPAAKEPLPGAAAYPEREIPHPAFLKKDGSSGTMSGAAMGSAYHLVLASLDFTKHRTAEHIQALLETMRKCDRIQKEEASGIDAARIAQFLATPLAQRMREASQRNLLWREQPFVISRRADLIKAEWGSEETVLLQGIIDAFFIEQDQVVLIDYKTDRARPGDEESLVRRYRVQFELYADALGKLLKLPVKEAWLYSLSLQKAVRVDLSCRQHADTQEHIISGPEC